LRVGVISSDETRAVSGELHRRQFLTIIYQELTENVKTNVFASRYNSPVILLVLNAANISSCIPEMENHKAGAPRFYEVGGELNILEAFLQPENES
jgi:hypothetical protein